MTRRVSRATLAVAAMAFVVCGEVGVAEEAAGEPAHSAGKDDKSVVLAILFGLSNVPSTRRVSIQKPFGKFANISRTIDSVKHIDRCHYEIESTVISDDAMASESGKWRYRLDFSKVGLIGAKLAPNAYEALSWSPIMFLYPAQKEMALRHRVSNVIRVTLNSDDKKSYCGQNLSSTKPEYCFSGKAFEIDSGATSLQAIKAQVRYFKDSVCRGETGPPGASVPVAGFPLQGKWAPSVQQCLASDQTDADDSITFSKDRIISSSGPPCVAKSVSVENNIVSSSEICGNHPMKRKTKIVDGTHIVLNFGDNHFATNYIKCAR